MSGVPKPKTIITCFENIATLFNSNLKHNLKQTNRLILTNKYNRTLHEYRNQIADLKMLRNCQWVNNFQPALTFMTRQKQAQQNDNAKSKGLFMLVGQPEQQLYDSIKSNQIVTLEEMCALFPEKVPLSYRTRENEPVRRKLTARLGHDNWTKQPTISGIYYTGQTIKMWDEAIQVVLDHQPCWNIVEFEHAPHNYAYYRLTMQDFMKAVSRCYEIVYADKQGKSKGIPNVVDFNEGNRQLEWIIDNKVTGDRSGQKLGTVVVDEDLVNDRDSLFKKYGDIYVERVDQNSSLWVG